MGIYIRTDDQWAEIGDLRRYNGTEWESASLSRYNGTGWELLWPVHFPRTVTYSLEDYVVYTQSGNRIFPSNYLCIGTQSGLHGSNYDTLMFFPLEQMKADLGEAYSITKATLTLRRLEEDSGEDTAPVTLGCTLSGMDPASPPSTFDMNYQGLLSGNVNFRRNQTRTFSFSTDGIRALLDGTADCLCLPTSDENFKTGNCFAQFLPEKTVLTVTYMT